MPRFMGYNALVNDRHAVRQCEGDETWKNSAGRLR